MKIAIDYSIRAVKNRGISRFVDDLIESSPYEIIALAPEGSSVKHIPNIIEGFSFFPWWEQYELPRLCKKYKFDILICPYNTAPIRKLNKTILITACHDLIFFEKYSLGKYNYDIKSFFANFYRKYIVKNSLPNADIIITVSNYSKKNIKKYFKKIDSKFFIIPSSISKNFLRNKLPNYDRNNSLLTVSGHLPSKNLKNLLKAFALVFNKLPNDSKLIVVGLSAKTIPYFEKFCSNLGIFEAVIFKKFISDKELINYYCNSKTFILASLSEGFGIPLVEAMACGTPILCSNTSSIPEVVADCGYYFNPYKIEEISQLIEESFKRDFDSNSMVKKGFERANKYFPSKYQFGISKFWKELKFLYEKKSYRS